MPFMSTRPKTVLAIATLKPKHRVGRGMAVPSRSRDSQFDHLRHVGPKSCSAAVSTLCDRINGGRYCSINSQHHWNKNYQRDNHTGG
jgi:hypothetical protein